MTEKRFYCVVGFSLAALLAAGGGDLSGDRDVCRALACVEKRSL